MASSFVVEDSTLESMTTSLLQVSSVFLVQQNELQEMHNRLQKELARMVTIQNALSEAAQQHQDAVRAADHAAAPPSHHCIARPPVASSASSSSSSSSPSPDQNPVKIVPRTSPVVHLVQFFAPDPLLPVLEPESGL